MARARDGPGTRDALEQARAHVGQTFGEADLVEVQLLPGCGGNAFGHGNGLQQAQGADGQGGRASSCNRAFVEMRHVEGGELRRDMAHHAHATLLPQPSDQ
jgi:hypothetical protein